MPKGIPADIPNRQQLHHWETVCRFLDAQPFRAVAYPYPRDPPISTRLLKRMARFQLVRHRDDCRWQLLQTMATHPHATVERIAGRRKRCCGCGGRPNDAAVHR